MIEPTRSSVALGKGDCPGGRDSYCHPVVLRPSGSGIPRLAGPHSDAYHLGRGIVLNWSFKSSSLPGNMMVAFSVSVTFVFGGVAVGNLNSLVLTFGVLAFIFDLSEEIINGALDAKGDEKRGSRSIAIRYGRRTAIRSAGVLFASFIVISFIPFVAGWLGIVYLIMVSCVDIAVIILFSKLKDQDRQDGGGKEDSSGFCTSRCCISSSHSSSWWRCEDQRQFRVMMVGES